MHPIQLELNHLVGLGLPGAFASIEEASGRSQFFTAGYSDLDSHTEMGADLRYRIGSTTKTFTAVVALQLIAEGKLRLHDLVQQWLPDLEIPNGPLLTVEHLLRMRSGLFDFEDDESLLGNLEAHLKPCKLSQAVDLAIKHLPIFAPGSRYSYCNTNFCILEMIIQRITGNSLGTEFRRRIFEPLQLNYTSYPDEDDLSLPEPYIRGYERSNGGWRECSEVFFGRDGAIISTAIDLAKFFRALLIERSLLPENSIHQMMSVFQDDPPAEKAYGLGLIADPLPGGTVWGHSGAGFGYRNFPFMRIDTGCFAVFMQNGTYGFRKVDANTPAFSNELRAMAYTIP